MMTSVTRLLLKKSQVDVMTLYALCMCDVEMIQTSSSCKSYSLYQFHQSNCKSKENTLSNIIKTLPVNKYTTSSTMILSKPKG